MKEPADLYALLRFYANRTRSPSFSIETFISFLEKYAKRYAPERPDLAPWAEGTTAKVLSAISALIDSGRCSWIDNAGVRRIVVAQFYVDLVQHTYLNLEEASEIPFPDDTSLKVKLPADRVRAISLEENFIEFLEESENEANQLIKLVFADNLGSIIALSGMVPRKLLELSFKKVGNYIRSHNNKEYSLHKLAPAFQGKESLLKDRIGMLATRPLDALADLERAGDFTYSFWAYFANLVKSDLKKKLDKLAEDIALLQSVTFIEFFNNYYKGLEQKARSAETALHALDVALDKAPFYFTRDEMTRFTDSKGVPLLGQYSREEMEQFLRQKTTAGDMDGLPPLLIVQGGEDERWYIKKTNILQLCARLIGEARPRVKSALTQRWFKTLKDFGKEISMADNDAFEKELAGLTQAMAPKLAALLREKSLYLVHQEMDGKTELPDNVRLFNRGSLAPYSELYLLARKDLLVDVKMMLPFWYTIPLLAYLAALFKGSKRQKPRSKKTARANETMEAGQEAPAGAVMETNGGAPVAVSNKVAGAPKNDKRAEMIQAARIIEKKLIPKDREIGEYMEFLRDHWNRIIEPKAKSDLTEDVNSLIRDYLRKTARSMRAASFTADRVKVLAETLSEAPALEKLPAREALKTYIQVYMVQLVIKS